MIRLVGLAAFVAPMTAALAGPMSASCTVHDGIVVCFSLPGAPPIASDGPCYAAQKQVVAAQNYAAEHSGEPEIVAQRMAAATDKLFKACAAFPVPPAADSVVLPARNG